MKTIIILLASVALASCGAPTTTQIAENTFVHKNKIYKMIDNEVTEVGDLTSDSIRSLGVLKPVKKDLGMSTLNYVKRGAAARLNALYRGNYLYYHIIITGINDLKDNFRSGQFTVDFQDEFGFNLHTVEIPSNLLTGIVDDSGEIQYFEFKNRFEISTDINKAIRTIAVSSSVRRGDY